MIELKPVIRGRLILDVKNERRTIEDIAKEYSVPVSEMKQILFGKSAKTNTPKPTISKKLTASKIKRKVGRPSHAFAISQLYNLGETDSAIAYKLHISVVTVINWRKANNKPANKKR